jgi:hypothetical protein
MASICTLRPEAGKPHAMTPASAADNWTTRSAPGCFNRRGTASGNIGTAVGAENDHGPIGASVLTRFSYSRRALRWAGTAGAPWPPTSGWHRARS